MLTLKKALSLQKRLNDLTKFMQLQAIKFKSGTTDKAECFWESGYNDVLKANGKSDALVEELKKRSTN